MKFIRPPPLQNSDFAISDFQRMQMVDVNDIIYPLLYGILVKP
jgi:hypothetical protein